MLSARIARACTRGAGSMIKQVVAVFFVSILPILPSEAAEQSTPFNFALDGSVPVEFDSNINRVPHNATADFHYSPYLKLSALTNLRPDLTYSIYADTSVNRYIQYFNNNGSAAGLGTQLTKKWDALQLGAVYEWNSIL